MEYNELAVRRAAIKAGLYVRPGQKYDLEVYDGIGDVILATPMPLVVVKDSILGNYSSTVGNDAKLLMFIETISGYSKESDPELELAPAPFSGYVEVEHAKELEEAIAEGRLRWEVEEYCDTSACFSETMDGFRTQAEAGRYVIYDGACPICGNHYNGREIRPYII